jgi:GT2 family glycosyltransferase
VSSVDVVVVAYNNRDTIRGCVEPLAADPRINVVVVDNASPDRSLEVVTDLALTRVVEKTNRGFGHGCNAGWRAGAAPAVLFLNPDTRMSPDDVLRLAQVVEDDPSIGAAGPRISDGDGALDFSQRRFPRLRSTYAQALFVHRAFPRAEWGDEVIRDPRAYAGPRDAEWLSGACLLVRRDVLVQVEGFDAGFFMYCEDKDLCRRVALAGYRVRYEPSATCIHIGGLSAPRSSLLPTLTDSRIRFARKHQTRLGATAERAGIALGALTHALASRGGREMRAGYGRSFIRALGPSRTSSGGAGNPTDGRS